MEGHIAMNVNAFPPSRDLYNRVRAGFITQDTTLQAWCRENDILRQNALNCLVGVWNGPKAKALRARLIKAANIPDPSKVS